MAKVGSKQATELWAAQQGSAGPDLREKGKKAKDIQLNYPLRAMACLVVLALHLELLWGQDNISTWLWVLLLAHCLVFPHVAFLFTRTPEQESRNIILDSFFYAFCLGVWGFNLYLTAIFVSCSNMTNLAAGGRGLLLKGGGLQLVGLLLGGLSTGFYFRDQLDWQGMLIATVGLVVYTTSLGFLIFNITRSLRTHKDRLSYRQKELEHINTLAQAVNTHLDLDKIMEGLMKTFESLYPFESLYVITYSQDRKTLKIVGAYGSAVSEYEENAFKELEMDIEKDSYSIFVSGLNDRRIINISNLTADAVRNGAEVDKVLYNIKPSRSIAYFPVYVQNQVVAGVAFINYNKRFELKDRDLKRINEYLVQVGTAIQNVVMLEKANQATRQAQQSEEAKSRFLANMSHEIRTPMTAILGYSEAMLDKSLSAEQRETFLNTIIRSGKHLLSIINDILDISKIESSNIEVENIDVEMVSVISDLDDYAKLHCKEKGLSYQLQVQYPIPNVIKCDPTRLKQILFNLTNNAVKFTANGWIKIEISYAYEQMIFSVEDSGIGLDREEQGRVFKAFTQADSSTTRLFGGTGLGLYISKNLAQLMGGDLTLESEKDVGSCFTLTVSAGEVDESNIIASAGHLRQLMDDYKASTQAMSIPKLRGQVLVAEDNIENQKIIQHLLEQTGVSVTVVDDGLQAYEKVKSQPFDLVFLDMQMPVMGGQQSAIKMRELGLTVPIVAFTANVMKHQVESYLTSGFSTVVEKPISQNQLYRVLLEYLKPQQSAGIVMVVEDNLVNQKLLQRMVQKANEELEVLVAANGEEAVGIARTQKIDLVLMDMEMPVMGGLEATEVLRQDGFSGPIYIVTGNVDMEHKQQAAQSGADGHLAKPIDKERLQSLINKTFS